MALTLPSAQHYLLQLPVNQCLQTNAHNTLLVKHYHFPELPSTNDTAKELLRSFPHLQMLVVTADMQTNGRGRNGKVWAGEAGGNVYCSFALRHPQALALPALVSYQAAGCLAAKAAIWEASVYAGFSPKLFLKYPNDVYIRLPVAESNPAATSNPYRKICGVLVEHEFIGSDCVASVIGIGINVRQTRFPDDVQHKASSLFLAGIDVSPDTVCTALMRYAELFFKQSSDTLFAAWRDELHVEQAYIIIHGEQGFWRVERLQDDGRLLVVHTETHATRLVDNGDSIVRTDWL